MIFKLLLIDVEMILGPCGARFARRLSNPIGIRLRSDFVSIWVPFEVPFGIHLEYIWGSKSHPFGGQFGIPSLVHIGSPMEVQKGTQKVDTSAAKLRFLGTWISM